MPAGEETPVAGHESVPSTPRPGAANSPPAAEAQAADHSQCCGGHGDHSHHHHAPPPLTFPGKWWKCCGCGSVAPGVAEQGLGPQQLVQRADLLWQQGLMLHNMKVDGGGKVRGCRGNSKCIIGLGPCCLTASGPRRSIPLVTLE